MLNDRRTRLFRTIKPVKDCKVYLEICSDDWNLDFKPYVFTVAW